jgi:hypothetical protein
MSRGQRGGVIAALIIALAAKSAWAGSDPKFLPGLDPGGTAIALITDGVDYTDPEIASHLARDGEGEPIAIDLVDGDVRPYAPAGSGRGTELAKRLLGVDPRSRLIVIRAEESNPVSLASAVAFVTRTPARIAMVGFLGGGRESWAPFAEAAVRAHSVLFIVPGGDARSRSEGAVLPTDLKLGNLIVAAAAPGSPGSASTAAEDASVDAWVVEPGAMNAGDGALKSPKDSLDAAALLAGQAGCVLRSFENDATADASRLKAALLSQARPIQVGDGYAISVHDPLC